MLYFWKNDKIRLNAILLMFKKTFIFIFLSVCILQGCTRDDLCPADTATTPNMIVLFKDFRNPDSRKVVEGLSIETDDPEEKIVYGRNTMDSIVLPLNVNTQTTAYRFIKTTIIEEDTLVNTDKILFTYEKNDVYVNRACGFRAEFKLLDAELEDRGSASWIKQIIINRDSIVDETKAHLSILH